MSRVASRRPWWPVAAGGAALILLAAIVLRVVAGPPASPPSAEESARVAAVRFLDRYLEPSGRVVRHDQGGDTVSEGQAYALLLAVAISDRARFDRAWAWTKTHLQRADGLLAWRWDDGRVADPGPASDADIDAAHALVLAAQRFGQAGYLGEGARIARSVLAKETVDLASEAPVLVAGLWARTAPYVVNPSYFAPTAFAALASATGDPHWTALGASSYQLIRQLTTDPPSLPPDWAELDESRQARPIASPTDRAGPSRYGFDAGRLLVRMATDCTATGRILTRTAGRLLPRDNGPVVAVYDVQANPLVDFEHPLGYVAATARAVAEGDQHASHRLLARAEELDRRQPTYYGAAWVALGRVTLTTSLLGGCAVPSPPP